MSSIVSRRATDSLYNPSRAIAKLYTLISLPDPEYLGDIAKSWMIARN